NKHSELYETEKGLQDKIDHQTTAFTERFQSEGKLQKKMKDDLDKQFKTERMGTNVRQQQEIGKMTNTHTQALEVRDTEFRKGLKEQDLRFEKKFGENLELRNKDLKSLEELNTKVLSKMKTDLKETLETSVNRSDDPFYKFTELNPKLKQFEDRVEISVPIPEHAKADVLLTMHGKEAILNFNRRYDDARNENGVHNKLHKVESFTSRVMTGHHLNPKDVKQSYDDGVMTYVIKKA
ncbi:MAG: hypothetical protein H0V66_08965, partial [Bdellovibrionales bacterium]|nr:hypothetical protein [Bdellovibrionales bacterium]